MSALRFDTQTTSGDPVQVVIVRPGDNYGRSAVNNSDRHLLEFRLGWACFQYHLGTFITRGTRGLILDGGQAKHTTIEASEMDKISTFVIEYVEAKI